MSIVQDICNIVSLSQKINLDYIDLLEYRSKIASLTPQIPVRVGDFSLRTVYKTGCTVANCICLKVSSFTQDLHLLFLEGKFSG